MTFQQQSPEVPPARLYVIEKNGEPDGSVAEVEHPAEGQMRRARHFAIVAMVLCAIVFVGSFAFPLSEAVWYIMVISGASGFTWFLVWITVLE